MACGSPLRLVKDENSVCKGKNFALCAPNELSTPESTNTEGQAVRVTR